MASAEPLYPPSPSGVPADLTAPSHEYKTHVVLVLCGIIAFFGLYFLLMIGSLALAVLCLFLPLPLINLFLAVFFLFLFLFLVKVFFKRRPGEKNLYVEINPAEHPRLYDFIDRLCRETRAPFSSLVLSFQSRAKEQGN